MVFTRKAFYLHFAFKQLCSDIFESSLQIGIFFTQLCPLPGEHLDLASLFLGALRELIDFTLQFGDCTLCVSLGLRDLRILDLQKPFDFCFESFVCLELCFGLVSKVGKVSCELFQSNLTGLLQLPCLV